MVCGALCLAGIGYIWAKAQVWALSKQIKTLELRRDELKRNNERLEQRYASMCTPAQLDAEVKRLKLGLIVPHPDQMVRLEEPVLTPRGPQEKVFVAHSGNQ
jgi:cell division protein FtsB